MNYVHNTLNYLNKHSVAKCENEAKKNIPAQTIMFQYLLEKKTCIFKALTIFNGHVT